MAVKAFVVAVLLVCIAKVSCHTYYLGSCPRVEPMNDFDITKVKSLENIYVVCFLKLITQYF